MMKFKSSTIFISVLLIGLLLYGFVSLSSNDPYKDYAPGTELSIANTNGTADTVTPGNWPYPTVWNWNYSGITGVNGGTVGACYYADHYWLNRWNSTNLYLYDNTGTNGGPGTQTSAPTYQRAIRDMTVAPDGSGNDFIWGSAASNTLFKFSPTGTTLGMYSIPQQMRAIVWDPNRKGFWACNWTTDIKCYDTTGALKDTYAAGLDLVGKYGLAWDSGHAHQDTATLFVWHQTPGQTLTEVNLTTKTIKRSFLISAGTHIAGGAEAYKSSVNNDLWLVLNYQNYAVVAYKIGDIISGITNNQIPVKYELSQNYPNPFNPITNIHFSISKSGNVTLKFYDIRGREVAVYYDGFLNAGKYNVEFDGSGLSSGVYFYRLVAGGFFETKKMVLTK